jgi:hypothetical protein
MLPDCIHSVATGEPLRHKRIKTLTFIYSEVQSRDDAGYSTLNTDHSHHDLAPTQTDGLDSHETITKLLRAQNYSGNLLYHFVLLLHQI